MRQDQYEKLQALTEKLTDTFLEEADPGAWPGKGIEIAAMDQQTRGDRYWCKKNAAATLSVIIRTTSLVGIIQQRADGGADVPKEGEDGAQEEASLEAEINAAEKEAERLINKALHASAKAEFDKRVHGKA